MFKLLFILLIMFVALAFIVGMALLFHKFLFEQDLQDTLDVAVEDARRAQTEEEASKIRENKE